MASAGEHVLSRLEDLCLSIPVAPKDKPSPIDRSYFADSDGWLVSAVQAALRTAGNDGGGEGGGEGGGGGIGGGGGGGGEWHAEGRVRILRYTSEGGQLPAHVDLPRTCSVPTTTSTTTTTTTKTTHSFLIYLTDCARGGETVLLDALPGDAKVAHQGGVAPGDRKTLARVVPRRGRLLLMPHACPHAAAPVVDAPKVVIRGECVQLGV